MSWNVVDPAKFAGYRLDATPGQRLGVAGSLPFICHQACATPAALQFMEDCGLKAPTAVETYRTEEEAASLARKFQMRGGKLVHSFGTLDGCAAANGQLVPIDVLLHLNAKLTLPELVPDHHLPKRVTTNVAQLKSVEPDGPVYVKMAGEYSNGGGGGVRFCADQEALASVADEFGRRLDASCPVVVEDEIATELSWCAGVNVGDTEVNWLGASLQVFSKAGVLAGNFKDGQLETPREIRELAIAIAKRARRRGFVGVAGFDILSTRDNELFVVDLNFRLNASTSLLLLFDDASMRFDRPVAHSVFLRSQAPLERVLSRLRELKLPSSFIPDCLFDANCYRTLHGGAWAETCVDGWIFAQDRSAALTAIADLRREVDAL